MKKTLLMALVVALSGIMVISCKESKEEAMIKEMNELADQIEKLNPKTAEDVKELDATMTKWAEDMEKKYGDVNDLKPEDLSKAGLNFSDAQLKEIDAAKKRIETAMEAQTEKIMKIMMEDPNAASLLEGGEESSETE